MKIAVTGKGGVGKTTLSAVLASIYAGQGKTVFAVDADPDANLAQALGADEQTRLAIRPIAELSSLIEERTGARKGSWGGIFRMNPDVSDIPDIYGTPVGAITVIVMGKPKSSQSGCYCPENILLKRLLGHLLLDRDEVVIADMEAGIEHMSRGTAEAVDAFIVVVEPGQRSVGTAKTIQELAHGLGVRNVFAVANKVRNEKDISALTESLSGIEIIGSIPYRSELADADREGKTPFGASPDTVMQVQKIREEIERRLSSDSLETNFRTP